MKNTLIAVFIATAIALGAVCLLQWQKLAAQKTQLGVLRTEAEQKTQELAELQASQQLNEQQRQELSRQATDLANKLQARQQADAKMAAQTRVGGAAATEGPKPARDKEGLGSFLAKLMEDPDTKKMIHEQQRMMLDQLYDPLIKKLDLTPAEAAQFKDLLADNMMKSAEKATSLLGGDGDTNRAAVVETMTAEHKDFEEQIRGFLGETRYAQYQDYQQTVGERTQLSQFRQQTTGENALTDRQTEQLLAFMKEEKQAVAAASGQPPPGAGQDAANLQAMLSGGGVEKLLQSQETVNQRVYDRAREVLSPDQLGAFGKFQTNQLQMMRMGMSMARKFMTPDKAEGTPPAPNP
jgi:hypothetical protein